MIFDDDAWMLDDGLLVNKIMGSFFLMLPVFDCLNGFPF